MLFNIRLVIGLIADRAFYRIIITYCYNFRNVLRTALTIGRVNLNHMLFIRTTTQRALNELFGLRSFACCIAIMRPSSRG